MKIFGDDGFRDIYGTGLMDKKFLEIFFYKINLFLKLKKINKIIIGYDTRKSYQNILKIILNNINQVKDIEILDKPVPTPCLSYLSKKYKKTFLIMITASHFDRKFNGFKFFLDGKKLQKNYEKKIIDIKNYHKKITKKKINISYTNKYILYEKFINLHFKKISLNKKVLVDFANGSSSTLIKKINFFKKVDKINYNYNLNNINYNCGSNYLKKTSKKLINKKYDYILAFDGDADRLTIFKKNYGLIEPEKVAYIFASFLKSKRKNYIISTLISNPGLNVLLKEKKIQLLKTKVGDRNVINLQEKKNALLGFETSGHYSFMNFMDGIYAAGIFLLILSKNEKLILRSLQKKLNYKLYKLNLKKTKKLFHLKKLMKKKNNLKILLRKSMWEKIYRLYIFYTKEDKKLFLNTKNYLKFLFK